MMARLVCLLLSLWLIGCGGSGGGGDVALLVPAPVSLPNQFNIQLRFVDQSLTPQQEMLVQKAAERWQTLILRDLPDTPLALPAGTCASTTPATQALVDDLLIDVSSIPIDGIGGVLAQAGPCRVRPQTLLPFYGILQLDVADLDQLEQSRLFEGVALHEMGHVLGFGLLWTLKGFLANVGSDDPRYSGSTGVAQFKALGGVGGVPVENRGNPSARNVHWRQSVFGSELMTSVAQSEAASLSLVTLAAMVDLGYTVNWQGADPFLGIRLNADSEAVDPPFQELPLAVPITDPSGNPLQP